MICAGFSLKYLTPCFKQLNIVLSGGCTAHFKVYFACSVLGRIPRILDVSSTRGLVEFPPLLGCRPWCFTPNRFHQVPDSEFKSWRLVRCTKNGSSRVHLKDRRGRSAAERRATGETVRRTNELARTKRLGTAISRLEIRVFVWNM